MFPIISRSLLSIISRSFGHLTNVPDHFPIISRSFPAVWVVWQCSRSFPAVCSRSFPAVWRIWYVPDHFPLFAPDHFLHMFRLFFRQIIQCLTSQGSIEYFLQHKAAFLPMETEMVENAKKVEKVLPTPATIPLSPGGIPMGMTKAQVVAKALLDITKSLEREAYGECNPELKKQGLACFAWRRPSMPGSK